jgi:hypothetical protein
VYGGKQAIRQRTSVLGFTSAYPLEDLGDGASAGTVIGDISFESPHLFALPTYDEVYFANMALNLAPFGRWTLRDKAAQRH